MAKLGFKPDFETGWGTGTLFQYIGKDDEVATLQKTDGPVTLVLPEDSIGYERIFGVTQVETERSLPLIILQILILTKYLHTLIKPKS